MNSKKLRRRALDILNQMYEEATPPMDFQHAWDNPEEYQHDWYMGHALSAERQREIVKSHTIRMRSRDKMHIEMAVLNWGPMFTEKEKV